MRRLFILVSFVVSLCDVSSSVTVRTPSVLRGFSGAATIFADGDRAFAIDGRSPLLYCGRCCPDSGCVPDATRSIGKSRKRRIQKSQRVMAYSDGYVISHCCRLVRCLHAGMVVAHANGPSNFLRPIPSVIFTPRGHSGPVSHCRGDLVVRSLVPSVYLLMRPS